MMNLSNGSTANNPDLDWSQLKETILMLNLAVAQIDQSMNDGNSSVETLSKSFTGLATNLSDIQATIPKLTAEDDNSLKIRHIIQGATITATDKVQTAIVAFQFYDKLTQRLDHVSNSLASLTELIANPNALYSPLEWQKLQAGIRSKYTMEAEKNMFDKVIAGVPIATALEEFNQEKLSNELDEDDIELF